MPSKAASPTVYLGIGIREATGTTWIDNIQLEEGTAANRCNLIENEEFTNKGLAWTSWYDNSPAAAGFPPQILHTQLLSVERVIPLPELNG